MFFKKLCLMFYSNMVKAKKSRNKNSNSPIPSQPKKNDCAFAHNDNHHTSQHEKPEFFVERSFHF